MQQNVTAFPFPFHLPHNIWKISIEFSENCSHFWKPQGEHSILDAEPLAVLVLAGQLDLLVIVLHPRQEQGDKKRVAVAAVFAYLPDVAPHRQLLGPQTRLLPRLP